MKMERMPSPAPGESEQPIELSASDVESIKPPPLEKKPVKKEQNPDIWAERAKTRQRTYKRKLGYAWPMPKNPDALPESNPRKILKPNSYRPIERAGPESDALPINKRLLWGVAEQPKLRTSTEMSSEEGADIDVTWDTSPTSYEPPSVPEESGIQLRKQRRPKKEKEIVSVRTSQPLQEAPWNERGEFVRRGRIRTSSTSAPNEESVIDPIPSAPPSFFDKVAQFFSRKGKKEAPRSRRRAA